MDTGSVCVLTESTFHRRLVFFGLLSVLCLSGCASYQVGHRSLYRPDVRTVHVPIFESESLRPGLGERLTEAVIREIQLRTPYKVVATPAADSTLSGRIKQDTKRVLARNRNNDARGIQDEMDVEVSWISSRGDVLMQTTAIPFAPLGLSVSNNAYFIPEAGQSLATAQQDAIENLAREIVGKMEIWW
jgi:hypothetical protein